MNTLTIQTKRQNDYQLLKDLLKRLNIKIIDNTSTISNDKKEMLLKLIEAGGDGKSITNPVQWQKSIRKDRNLPRKK